MADRIVTLANLGSDPDQCAGLQLDVRVYRDNAGSVRVRLDCRIEGDPTPPAPKENAGIPAPVRTALRALVQAILNDKPTMLGVS